MDHVEKYIADWINELSVIHKNLDNFPVCPFAKKSKYKIVKLSNLIIKPNLDNIDLIVYVLNDSFTFDDINKISAKYNKLYPSLVFLPDSKDRYSEINGIQTNNKKYNIILCQKRTELESARNKLKDTTYYSFWNKEYLKEILSQ